VLNQNALVTRVPLKKIVGTFYGLDLISEERPPFVHKEKISQDGRLLSIKPSSLKLQ
jgi:hypothetical protein